MKDSSKEFLEEIKKHIINKTLSLIVKPSSPKNEILGWDEERKAIRVSIAAAPDKDKANKEVIKYFSKILGQRVTIKKGMRSKEKVIEII